ncbi:MAG: aerobic respiration two-component sensor histidine kinase ArcB [Aeromonadaceae bacterium]
MRQITSWAQYYVDWLTRLGIIRFSLLLAFFIILLAVVIQMGVTLLLRGAVDTVDIVRSVFFGLLVTPWAAYFLTAVVDELEDSRQRLTHMVSKLQEMRERDQALNLQLQSNISQLNQQIEETLRVEVARQQAMSELKAEVKRREQTQAELEERNALVRSFIDSSPDLIYFRNEAGQFSGCNQAMERLAGRTEEELIGLTPWDIYTPAIAEKVMESDREVFARNRLYTYEQWMEYPDGHKVCFEMRKVPFYDGRGKRLGLLGFGRDVTERKRYQEQLEKASRDKTTFVSTISHELRTPLNGIVGLSRILLDTPLSHEQRRQLNTIHLSAVTLGNIFNDIIDLDKLDRHKLHIAPARLDLPAFLHDLELLTRLMTEQKGLYFNYDFDGELPHWVLADGTRLRQVLWNLTGNAVKFTEEGGISLRVYATELAQRQVRLRFEVEDTGIGIPAAELDKIFAMYYQVKSQKYAVGTGIGLAVAHQLVEAMGGTLTADSEEGHGSCFTLELTVEWLDETQEELPMTLPSLRILMVEDVELNITVATALLEKLGHQVTVARNGQEALMLANPDEFDLFLLDIQLPDMTGFDIADALLERYGRERLPPMVALTANLISDKSEYYDHGMVAVIGKPLAVDKLNSTLRGLFVSCPLNGTKESSVDDSVLELGFLEEYASMVGKPVLLQAVTLFEQMMPEYLALLDSNLVARDEKGIASEAHKIKSAAGAIGLKRIHALAKQAQSPELPAWWENIADWIEGIRRHYPEDLAQLKLWLQV